MSEDLAEAGWHRVHPLTPLLRGGFVLVAVGGIVLANLRERLLFLFVPAVAPPAGIDDDPVDWILANNLSLLAAGAVLVLVCVLVLLAWLAWRARSYRITGDDVEVRSGVVFRAHRRAPLDRVQSVNLTRPFLARLLGLAQLEVVGAGLDANVRLEYLTTQTAEQVRADILRLASGRRSDAAVAAGRTGPGPAADGEATPTTLGVPEIGGEVPPASVVVIPTGRLIASRLLSTSTLVLVIIVIVVVAVGAAASPWMLFALVPAALGVGTYLVRSTLRSLRYSIAPTTDGIRVVFGLLTTITETVPPGRIHAIEVAQPLLWRGFGWWTVRINRLNGRSASDTSTDQFTTILPVGALADIERVLSLILPQHAGGEGAQLLRDGAVASSGGAYATTPARAKLLRPFSWRRNGVRVEQDLLLIRRGVIWRTWTIVPLARMQSLQIRQGPLARVLRLASLHADTLAGPVDTSVAALDREDALEIWALGARTAVEAAAADRSHRWAGGDAPEMRAQEGKTAGHLARSAEEGQL